ncbi:MAG: hypothetical protein JW983_09705 [Elusimicrobia bacterium]|nr:hypothetical protein [Elusimicrobiota bacterium]
MMKLQKNTKQIKGEPFRRWYSDDYFDLFVWFNDNDKIINFQLCYDKQGDEHSLTYTDKDGLVHEKIDSGEEDPRRNKSPVVSQDGLCPFNKITDEFIKRSRGLDKDIIEFVMGAIKVHLTEFK